jgi:hypothetical protein
MIIRTYVAQHNCTGPLTTAMINTDFAAAWSQLLTFTTLMCFWLCPSKPRCIRLLSCYLFFMFVHLRPVLMAPRLAAATSPFTSSQITVAKLTRLAKAPQPTRDLPYWRHSWSGLAVTRSNRTIPKASGAGNARYNTRVTRTCSPVSQS